MFVDRCTVHTCVSVCVCIYKHTYRSRGVCVYFVCIQAVSVSAYLPAALF